MDDPLGEAHLAWPDAGGPRPSRVYRSQPLFPKSGDSKRSSIFASRGSTTHTSFITPVFDQKYIAAEEAPLCDSLSELSLLSTESAYQQVGSFFDIDNPPPHPDSRPIIPRHALALNPPFSSSRTNLYPVPLPRTLTTYSYANRTQKPRLAADTNAPGQLYVPMLNKLPLPPAYAKLNPPPVTLVPAATTSSSIDRLDTSGRALREYIAPSLHILYFRNRTPSASFGAPVSDQECIPSEGGHSKASSYNNLSLLSTGPTLRQARSLLDSLVAKLPLPQWHWSYSRKRSKPKPHVASSPSTNPLRRSLCGLQFVEGCSAGSNWEPGGDGDPFSFDLSLFSGYGGFPDYSGSTNGDAIWSGQGSGSELQQALRINDKSHQVPLDSIEPAPDTLISQPYYYDGGNLPVQERLYAPLPPVPLSVHLQLNAWEQLQESNSVGLATNLPAHQPEYHDSNHSAINTPPFPPPSSTQPSAHEPEWHSGFVTGCIFASRGPVSWPQIFTSEWNKGFHAGCMFVRSAPPLLPGLTGSSAQAVAPLESSAKKPNTDIQSLSTAADPDLSTAQASPLPCPSQELADRAVADQPQAQPSSSTTEQIPREDTSHGARGNATSTTLESASGTNNASTSSTIGPIRRGSDRNRYACDECDKKFPQKQRLNNHIQRHHRGQPNAYLCDTPLCGRSFASEEGLKRHRKKCNLARETSNLDQG